MEIEVLYDVAVSARKDGDDRSENLTCAHPLTALSEDGSVVCVYPRGKEKLSYDRVWVSQRSTDMGRNWSRAVTIFDGQQLQPPQAASNGGICRCADGSLLTVFVVLEVTKPDSYIYSKEGFTQRYLLVTSRSHNGGNSWTPCRYIDETPLGKPLDPVSSPLLLANGQLFIPGERRHQGGQMGVCASYSNDHGQTLEPVQDCIVDPTGKLNLCDVRFALFDDGQVLALLWTFRAGDEETVEVHRSVSADHGRSWSVAQPVGYLGQIAAPLVVGGDTVLAACNYRWPPEGIRLWVSHDRGITWPQHLSVQMWDSSQKRIVAQPMSVSDHSKNEGVWNALPGFTFGTPDLTALPDSSILLTYYAEIEAVTQVRACRFVVK